MHTVKFTLLYTNSLKVLLVPMVSAAPKSATTICRTEEYRCQEVVYRYAPLEPRKSYG